MCVQDATPPTSEAAGRGQPLTGWPRDSESGEPFPVDPNAGERWPILDEDRRLDASGHEVQPRNILGVHDCSVTVAVFQLDSQVDGGQVIGCLLYTSDAADE